MPLLKGRFLSPGKPPKDIKPDETLYTIPHTKEVFRSKEEYDARLKLYAENIWTCQASGQIKLTHKEAWESEQEIIKSLKEEFQECWEKPILQLIHHSTDVLDVLTDAAWRHLYEEFHLGEEVTLTVGNSKTIEGTIAKVDKAGVDSKTDLCESPSSNKENSEGENIAEKRSQRKDCSKSPSKSPKKFTFPKLIPYKYSLKLKDEDKVVNGIPATDLKRVHKLPLKDAVKTFIRAFAWRGGSHQNSPWAVREDLVEKHHLQNKLAGIFLSPAKMSEIGKKLMEDKKKATIEAKVVTKRKRIQSQDKKTVKKLKTTSKASGKSTPGQLKKTQTKLTPKKSPKKSVTAAEECGSESDSSSDSDEDIPLSVIKSSPIKSTPKSSVNQDSTPGSTPRKRGRPSREESEKIRAEKDLKAKLKAEKKAQKANLKLLKKLNSDGSPKKRGRPKGSTNSPKIMKQATLFDMKGKKDGSSTPGRSPSKSPKKTPFKIPPLAQRLMKALDNNNKPVYHQLVARCAKLLPLSHIKQLPDRIKDPVMKRYNTIEEKKKLDKMKPEEKEEYLKKKKEEQKKRLNEMLKNKRLEQNKRYEDQDLVLKPLPLPKLVETPDGFANELFGNVVMVTEFISCYKALLTPKDDTTIKNVTTESLMHSLVSDHQGYGAVAHVLTTLLQTLLQDTIAEDYTELNLKLSEIPVNQYTASELVRLCLRKRDVHDDNDSNNSEEDEIEDDLGLPEDLIEKLETMEFYELVPEDKVTILIALCHRLMGSYSVQDYMEQKQRDAAELWKKRIAEQKEMNELKKGQKELRKELKKSKVKEPIRARKEGVTLNNFYGKLEDTQPEDGLDLASVVKRRRIMVNKMAELKKKQEEEKRLQRKEFEKEARFEILEKEFQDGIMAAKWAYRQAPLGSDRNHNRYWLFHKATPGLFVEKGWASNEIDYRVRDTDSDSSDLDDSMDESATSELKPGRKKENTVKCVEKTLPHTGQNLWFMYDNIDDVSELIENLHPLGARDSGVKAKLKEKERFIHTSMQVLSKKPPVELETVNMMEGFREELLDMEARLAAGGLGGIPNSNAWEKKLENAKTFQEFTDCLVECQSHIYDKFLKGALSEKKRVKKVKEETCENEEEDEDHTKDAIQQDDESDYDIIPVGLELWKETMETCNTFSRLHVLMGILETCVKWEKSAENAKCKICRRKGDDDKVLLCDQCNQAYHLYCLRPALVDIPDGEWFCPACVPSTRRVTRIKDDTKNYRMLAGYEDTEGSDTEDSGAIKRPNSLECEVCGGDEDIYPCSTCESSFHLDCHEPPLRREPRSSWRCMQCTSGVRIRKTKRAVTQKKTNYRYEDDDEYCDQPRKSQKSRDESDYRNSDRLKSRSNTKKARKRSSIYHESESEEEHPMRKSVRNARKPVKHYDQSETEEESDYEEEQTVPVKSSRRSRSSDISMNISGPPGDSAEVSPSSAHQTRRKGDSHLVNGDLIAKEMYHSTQKIMMEVLKKLRKHKSAWPFLEPVNPDHVLDYYEIVRKPMDLQTIENKCISEQYQKSQQFVDDILLMIDNSYLYNKPDSIVGKCTEPLEQHFCKLLEKHLPDCTYPRMPSSGKPMVNGNASVNSTPNSSINGGMSHSEIYDDHAYYSPKIMRR